MTFAPQNFIANLIIKKKVNYANKNQIAETW